VRSRLGAKTTRLFADVWTLMIWEVHVAAADNAGAAARAASITLLERIVDGMLSVVLGVRRGKVMGS